MRPILLLLVIPLLVFAQPASFDLRRAGSETRGAVTVEDVTFANATGGRTEAYLVIPPGRGKSAGALFVHWYESESPLSNRKQFLDEAVELGNRGLVSLLISTPWSDPDWYKKRDVTQDYQNYDNAAKDIERALDLLAAHPRVDAKRLAFVGHDYGAMHGLVAAVRSHRLLAAVALQAFTPKFSDWAMFGRKLTPDQRQEIITELAPLDPSRFLGELSSATPVLFQFATMDVFVPRERAEALYAAAPGPKRIMWYQAGHGLNDQASKDRQKWLRETLKLR
jgi:pimeloyl-ACP methyl ester carboxylesterase